MIEAAVPTVSVLIAAYNAEAFLARSVHSALAQTHGPLEVLVVDDGSTDRTVEVARALGAEDARVRSFEQGANGGPAKARNRGLDEARGDWVAVLDADDAYEPERLERLMQVADGADIVADNFRSFHASTGETSGPVGRTEPPVETVTTRSFLAHARPYGSETDWGLFQPCFRRAFMDAHGLRYPEHSRHGEDTLLMVQALLAGAVFRLVRTPGYLYTTRQSGWSRTRIDYEAMARHTLVLLNDPRIASDAELRALVHARAHAITRLAERRRARALVEEGRWSEAARAVMRGGPAARATLRQLGAFAASRAGLRGVARHLRQ